MCKGGDDLPLPCIRVLARLEEFKVQLKQPIITRDLTGILWGIDTIVNHLCVFSSLSLTSALDTHVIPMRY